MTIQLWLFTSLEEEKNSFDQDFQGDPDWFMVVISGIAVFMMTPSDVVKLVKNPVRSTSIPSKTQHAGPETFGQ